MSCDTFYARVNNKPHVFIRTESRFFDITDCSVLTNGHIDENDGLVPNAMKMSDVEVADLLAEAEEYNERLASAEAALRECISFRQALSRKAKQGSKRSLQKQHQHEVVK